MKTCPTCDSVECVPLHVQELATQCCICLERAAWCSRCANRLAKAMPNIQQRADQITKRYDGNNDATKELITNLETQQRVRKAILEVAKRDRDNELIEFTEDYLKALDCCLHALRP